MKLFKYLTIFLILLLYKNICIGQSNVRNSALNGVLIHANYGVHIPGADLAKRFGYNMGAGLGMMIKVKKSYIIGIQGNYYFGSKVKEDSLFRNIAASNGQIIGTQGNYVETNLQERGFNISINTGKIFPVIGPNPNSGLLISVGTGLFQHKIKIGYLETSVDNKAPQLEGDYLKGYDRLSNGLSFNEFIGYIHSSNQRFINFYIGIEAIESFTKNRRSWNIDERRKEDIQRFELLWGIKAGWFLPLYKRDHEKEYYY